MGFASQGRLHLRSLRMVSESSAEWRAESMLRFIAVRSNPVEEPLQFSEPASTSRIPPRTLSCTAS
jgi:hypothetical protein